MKIKMTGTCENGVDTREYFLITDGEESPIDRVAAGVIAMALKLENKLRMYEEDGCTIWEETT